MIITAAIILAIIGSAFSFKVKVSTFCVLTNTAAGTNCTTYLQNRKKSASGFIQYKYANCWDGDVVACTAPFNGLCTTQTTFVVD